MKKYFFTSLALIFCCLSFGQSNIVFVEDFPLNTATQRNCGTATVSSLVPGRGYTTYTYVGNNSAGNCRLDEDYYAIANHSSWSFWNDRTRVNEHTGTAGSGALMINAAANTNKFFYTLQLDGLCPGTQYEFSAWYVSIANSNEMPSDVDFQIFEGGTIDTATGIHTGGIQYNITNSNTGPFGGTAGNSNSNATSFVWRKKTIAFTTLNSSSAATQYFLKLKNNLGHASGNDLMIDDIMVVKYNRILPLYQAGTTNTSISVCNNDKIDVSVILSAADVGLISGNDTVYAQLMKSTDQTNWTAVASPARQIGAGMLMFTVDVPTNTGGVIYYRAKLSADEERAADISTGTTNDNCYNDIITQNFSVTKIGANIKVNIDENLTVCAGEDIYELLVSPTGNTEDMYPTGYELIFEQKAIDKGFQNITGTFNGGNIAEIPIPANITPDNYQFTIKLDNDLSQCGGTSYTRTLQIQYPSSIMEQKWNDVIALLNEGACGYAFAGYEWYKNGEFMKNEKKAYIYLAKEYFNIADCYQVLITREDGSQMFSCCAKLEVKNDCTVCPTIIQRDGVIGISSIQEKSTVSLYTITGILLQTQKFASSEYEFYVPTKGMYLLEIRTSSERQVVPIVVR